MPKMNESDVFGDLVETANRLVEQASKLLRMARRTVNGKPMPGSENIDTIAFNSAIEALDSASDRLTELAVYSMVPESVERLPEGMVTDENGDAVMHPNFSPNGWTDPD